MTRQWYIGMIAAFALGLALGAAIVNVSTRDAIKNGEHGIILLYQTQSDRDQAFGRLDECEGMLKAGAK